MALLAILVYFALISQTFGFALEPRLSGKLLPNDGLDKYNEPDSRKIGYAKDKIKGYYFSGNSLFDLPFTIGMLFQDFPREPGARQGTKHIQKVVKDKVKESLAAYVFAEKGVLVLGVPRTLPIKPPYLLTAGDKHTLRLAQFLWRHDVEITKTSYEGQNPETTHEVSSLKAILAEFQEDCGRILGAGVVGINGGGLNPIRFKPGFDALGLLLNKVLGIPVKAWRPAKFMETQPLLFYVTGTQRPMFEISIGKEVVMLWNKGRDPQYAPTADAIWDWTIDFADMGDDNSFNDCDTTRNDNEGDVEKKLPTAQKLFLFKTGRNHGGCEPSRQKTIANWLSESRELAKAGLQAFSDANDGDEIAIHTLNQFLGITPSTNSGEILKTQKWLQEVSDFLHGDLKLPSGTPRLFCGSTWLQQKTWDDDSLDHDGDVKLSDAGKPIPLHNDVSYLGYLKTQTSESRTESTGLVPYWSSDLKQFSFQRDYDNKGYCAYTGSFAATFFDTTPIAIELCPKAFSDRRGSDKLGAKNGASIALEKVCPRSGTLLHETFHFVHGAEDSPDATYNLEGIIEALKSPTDVPKSLDLDEPDKIEAGDENADKLTNLDLVRRNPETWAFFCVSYWYTLNKDIYFPFDGDNDGKGVSTTSQ